MPLMEAIFKRRSAREFEPKELPGTACLAEVRIRLPRRRARRLVGFDGEEIVGTGRADRPDDRRIGGDGSGETIVPFNQKRQPPTTIIGCPHHQ